MIGNGVSNCVLRMFKQGHPFDHSHIATSDFDLFRVSTHRQGSHSGELGIILMRSSTRQYVVLWHARSRDWCAVPTGTEVKLKEPIRAFTRDGAGRKVSDPHQRIFVPHIVVPGDTAERRSWVPAPPQAIATDDSGAHVVLDLLWWSWSDTVDAAVIVDNGRLEQSNNTVPALFAWRSDASSDPPALEFQHETSPADDPSDSFDVAPDACTGPQRRTSAPSMACCSGRTAKKCPWCADAVTTVGKCVLCRKLYAKIRSDTIKAGVQWTSVSKRVLGAIGSGTVDVRSMFCDPDNVNARGAVILNRVSKRILRVTEISN